MIAKMYFVSITGPKKDIDRIVDKYLSRYEIHLEYAPAELKTADNLHPFNEQNMYREQINHMEELAEHMGKPSYENEDMEVDVAAQIVDSVYEEYNEKKNNIENYSFVIVGGCFAGCFRSGIHKIQGVTNSRAGSRRNNG